MAVIKFGPNVGKQISSFDYMLIQQKQLMSRNRFVGF